MSTREEIRAERTELRKKYDELFDQIAEILFRHDPVGINFSTNTDEYEPEVGTILPRLSVCRSALDVRGLVHEEFVRWFDVTTAGAVNGYETIANEIWAAWQRSPLFP